MEEKIIELANKTQYIKFFLHRGPFYTGFEIPRSITTQGTTYQRIVWAAGGLGNQDNACMLLFLVYFLRCAGYPFCNYFSSAKICLGEDMGG